MGIIENCSVSGNVEGNGYVGGITGKNKGTITACHSSATVEGINVGGIAGQSNVSITACYSTGSVTACYWNSTVTNDTGIGSDMSNIGEATKVDGDWTEAMNAMNKALSDTGWQYVTSSGNAPLTLQRQN